MTGILFGSILTDGVFTGGAFLAATICSLVLGWFIAFIYSKTGQGSKSFLVTLALLPAIVELVIILVNGNIGAGVAVAGAFSLVRFRSAPGKGQEITSIFLAMAVGLATGMGYLGVAVLFALIITLVNYLLVHSSLGEDAKEERILKIEVPEGLDFEGVFDDLLQKYTQRFELTQVRTAGMGSIYKLTYRIAMKSGVSMKEMMDQIRQRNGNLEVSCGREVTAENEL